MRASAVHLVFLATMPVVGSAGPASAEVGEAVAVIQQAVASGQTGARTLAVGAPVFMGDLLRMGPIGETQLLFVDDTRLVVGPNSSLTIDEYIVRDQRTVSRLTVNAIVGSFRFITGLSPHEAYSIKTPNATIGVRGTSIDLAVTTVSTGVVVYSGAAEVCDENERNCVIAEAGCGAAVADPDGVLPVDEAEKTAFIEESFPYAVDQELLRADFKVDTGDCGLVIPANIQIDPFQPGAIQAIAASPS
ncbi:MAG: FecR family protein [Propylenella sp.]